VIQRRSNPRTSSPAVVNRCVAPLLVSKVSRVISRAQGAAPVLGRVTVTWARSVPRGAVRPEFANGRLTEDVTPDAMVKFVAVPTAVPAEFMNATLPVHDAAVPLLEFDARFVKLTRAVSVDPKPNVVRLTVRVRFVGVVVCASAHCTINPVVTAKLLSLVINNPLSL
jgi:hypothetical protein